MMPVNTAWLRYLWKERKKVILNQFIRMALLHKTPFKEILNNILSVTEQYQAGFTFPIVASSALKEPELINLIVSFQQEIASHGFKHLNYHYLSLEEQKKDIKKSLFTFGSLGVSIKGFRAPYNMYSTQTPKILEKFNFVWDGGIGFKPQYSEYREFFRIRLDNQESSYICIPLYKWSDDRMIDGYGFGNKKISKILKKAIRETAEKRGVLMFDLHPIRIGQKKYINLLREILVYGSDMKGWFPRVTEAVEYWLRYKSWKDNASFCCLLTGDIDNFTFGDYLTRLF
jgi:peptidoglycan/xylan/chitin deacetylase (PgdA/CDA1 family)